MYQGGMKKPLNLNVDRTAKIPLTEQIRKDAPRLKDSLVKKHYERKHGPHSYYGQ